MNDWTTIEQERSGIPDRTFYKVLCFRYGLCEWSLVGEACGDGCRKGAPRPMCMSAVDPWAGKFDEMSVVVEEVHDLRAVKVATGQDDRSGTQGADTACGVNRVRTGRDAHPGEQLCFDSVWCHDPGLTKEASTDEFQCIDI